MFGNLLLLRRLRLLVGNPVGRVSSKLRSFARIQSTELLSIILTTIIKVTIQHHHLLNQSPLCHWRQLPQRQTAPLYSIMVMALIMVTIGDHHLVWMTGACGIRLAKMTLIGLKYYCLSLLLVLASFL